jgi:cytochrome c-type protein NapB
VSDDSHGPELFARAAFIVAAIVAAVAFFVAVDRTESAKATEAYRAPVPVIDPPVAPIAAEAGVFRTNASIVAIDPADERHRAAHPRTLRTYRVLRAYPGAPPRIPHGFTADEFRTGACRTCHERGGFSPRFGAYVPVTPHPEMTACLQCHVGNDAVTGVPLPGAEPSTRCLQCHTKDPRLIRDVRSTYPAAEWPVLAPNTPNRPPPVIPHTLEWRGNCLACHSGPAAVAEIRTPHPERINCRQCHLTQEAQ